MTPSRPELEQLYAYPDSGRTWVRTNFVSTLDGAAYAEDGTSDSLGGPADKDVFALLRSLADVIVVGAGTARAEGYEPVRPEEVDADLRSRLGLSAVPPIAVVSRRLDIPEPLVAEGQLVITTADAPSASLEALAPRVDVIAVGADEIDWPAALDALAERGLHRVLCEGGPSLHGTLADLDLVDDLCLTIAPVMSAGTAPRIAHSPSPVDHAMELGHVFDADGVLLTRWVRSRP
jgi:riboflavin biosynthesis pyrimidine reductase